MTEIIRKIASYLVWLSVLAVILTLVQPMHPQVDRMFQIGAGIVFVVCLLVMFGLPAPKETGLKDGKSEEKT